MRLEALVGEKDAAWLSRLAMGWDDEEVRPVCQHLALPYVR